MTDSTMTDNQPYILRAMHEWICDNDCTPYLYVNTDVENVQVPEHLIGDNPLVLSASYSACKDIMLTNEHISFQSRFNGCVHDIYLPIESIIAITARENGAGVSFEWETSVAKNHEEPAAEKPRGLKIVK